MVMLPEILVQKMRRVARNQIISFPNFANIKNRFDLLFRGRMPRPMLYGYNWYSTGHIHQLRIRDFLELADQIGLVVQEVQYTSRIARLPILRFILKKFRIYLPRLWFLL